MTAMAAATEMRTRVRGLFEEIGLTEPQARDLEVGIYNQTLQQAEQGKTPKNWGCPTFKALYLAKARNIHANLDRGSYVENPRLLARIQEGEFVPHELPFMQPENMKPEFWNGLVEAEMRRRNASYELGRSQITDMFRCGRCKKNKCSYYEMQTRSADESSTIFVSCLSCGNRWKMG